MEYYTLDFYSADAIKCQAVPMNFIAEQNVSGHPPICRSAGQKLISMLMVLTNVLWTGCHFWADLNCPPELNCTVNYHIITFSAVIYVHIGAGVLQLIARGISAAGVTPNAAGCFSPSKHQSFSLHPPTPPHTFSALAFVFSVICSYFLSFSLAVLLAFILLFFAFFLTHSVWWCFHLLLYTFHLPPSIAAVFEEDDSEVPSGLYSSSASFIAGRHTHTHTLCHSVRLFFCLFQQNTLTHSLSISFFL